LVATQAESTALLAYERAKKELKIARKVAGKDNMKEFCGKGGFFGESDPKSSLRHGVFLCWNGNKYGGVFEEDKIISGMLQYDIPQNRGDAYSGEFLNNVPHGHGVYEWKDGRRFTGEFSHGMIEGLGVLEDAKMGRYIGQFKLAHFCGGGVLYAAQGHHLEGLWKGHRRNGYSRQHFPDKSYEDVFINNGIPEGVGIYTTADTKKRFFHLYKDGKKVFDFEMKPGLDYSNSVAKFTWRD
jgi:hypothetical protein